MTYHQLPFYGQNLDCLIFISFWIRKSFAINNASSIKMFIISNPSPLMLDLMGTLPAVFVFMSFLATSRFCTSFQRRDLNNVTTSNIALNDVMQYPKLWFNILNLILFMTESNFSLNIGYNRHFFLFICLYDIDIFNSMCGQICNKISIISHYFIRCIDYYIIIHVNTFNNYIIYMVMSLNVDVYWLVIKCILTNKLIIATVKQVKEIIAYHFRKKYLKR